MIKGFCWCEVNSKPGLAQTKVNKWLCSRDHDLFEGYVYVAFIEEGNPRVGRTKRREFSNQKNRNPRMSSKRLLEKYIFEDQYEIFFGSFHVELYEWISRLTKGKNYFKGEPKEWTPKLIQQLKNTDNRISRVVHFWIDSILGGFIAGFMVESTVSYNEA